MPTALLSPSLSVKGVHAEAPPGDFARRSAGGGLDIISDGILVGLLTFLFTIEMAGEIGGKAGPLAESLAYYGSDARSYVAVTAKTAGINALINLVFLVVMGVDTPSSGASFIFFSTSSPLWDS